MNCKTAIEYLNKHITKKKVLKYDAECMQLNEKLKKLFDEIENDNYESKINNECELIGDETDEERQERACKRCEWIKYEQKDMDSFDYARLCMNWSDCWYCGNEDRIQECQIFRLKGTEDTYICNICMDNSLELLVENHV
jgi:hypothetical protein